MPEHRSSAGEADVPPATAESARSQGRERGVGVAALALLVGVALAVLVGSVVDTAESRFAGSTDNRGSAFEAGEVQLSLATGQLAGGRDRSDRTELSLDASNLLPGQSIERCIAIGYSGSVDGVDLRMYLRNDDEGDSGLAPYLDTEVEIGMGDDPMCADFAPIDVDTALWTGSLDELRVDAGSFASGREILTDAASDATATVRIRLTLADDNRAQGLAASFWVVFEVRP